MKDVSPLKARRIRRLKKLTGETEKLLKEFLDHEKDFQLEISGTRISGRVHMAKVRAALCKSLPFIKRMGEIAATCTVSNFVTNLFDYLKDAF